MKRKALIFVFLHIQIAAVFGQSTTPAIGIKDKKPVYTLFKNAIVYLEPGKIDTISFIIYKNKIVQVDKYEKLEIPENTVIQNCKNLHVYPSFIELNSSFGLPQMLKHTNENQSPTYWNKAIHPEVNAVDYFSPDAKEAEALQKMGFGYALSHIKDGIMRGTSVFTQVGKENSNNLVLKTAAANHMSFKKGSSPTVYPRSLMGAVALIRQTYYDASWYRSANDKETNFSLEALANYSDLPTLFEASEKYDIVRLNRITNEFDKKYIVIDAGDSYQLQELNNNYISAIVAPLNFPQPYNMSDPDLGRLVPQKDLLHWEYAPFNPSVIQQKNIPLVLSANGITKAEKFFSNLRLSVKNGLSKEDALAALTTTPAGILQLEDKIGKIAPGYFANFFISDGDIFTDSTSKIIAHRISGEEIIFEDIHKHNLEANYTLNIDDVYFELRVKGKEKPKAEVLFISNSDTTSMKAQLSVQSNEVSLQFSFPERGYYRLSGTIINDNRIWNGRGYDPSGKSVLWNAIRRKAKPIKNKTDTLKTTPEDSIIAPPKLLFPMTAYGFDSLPQAETVIFKNATVWTNEDEGIVENADVLIAFGKIVAVGKSINPDDFLDKKNKGNYREVDATGKHITPGIIDEHSHIAIWRGVNEGTQASTAEVRISDALNPDDINILRQLAGGVTTSQLLHGSANPIGGQAALIKLRWGKPYEEMFFEGADPFIKFALGENVKQSNWGPQHTTRYPQTRMGVEQFYYEYFYRAREYGEKKRIAQGQNISKKSSRRAKTTKTDLADFRIDLEMEALLEILESKRFITCHSYVQSEINMLMHVADSMGFTVNTFTHILEGYKLADKMREHGAAASTFSDWWAYKFEVKDAIPYNATLLNNAGVVTAINSDDAEMARRLNQEAAKSMKYGGTSAEDALKFVTLNPAKMLHIDDRVGSLAPGKDADIVVWSAHPLSVYAIAEKTYIDGIKYFDRAQHAATELRDLKERARISQLMDEAASRGEKTQEPKKENNRYYHCETEEIFESY